MHWGKCSYNHKSWWWQGLRNSDKKAKNLTKKLKTRTLQSKRVPSKDNSELPGESLVQDCGNSDIDLESSSGSLNENVPVAGSSRRAVLQACVFTFGCLLALGAVVRQVSVHSPLNLFSESCISLHLFFYKIYRLEIVCAWFTVSVTFSNIYSFIVTSGFTYCIYKRGTSLWCNRSIL